MGGEPGRWLGKTTRTSATLLAGDVKPDSRGSRRNAVDVLTGGASATYGGGCRRGCCELRHERPLRGACAIDANAGHLQPQRSQTDGSTVWKPAKKQSLPVFLKVTGTPLGRVRNKDITPESWVIISPTVRGNFEGYLGYRRNSPITADHRDHSACVLTAFIRLALLLLGFEQFGADGPFRGPPAAASRWNPDGTLASKVYNRFNYAASHYLQRIDER